MAIYDLWLSRNNGPTVSNYVGHAGRLFFDPAERVLRISDGVTAGGEVFNGLVTVANTAPTANFQGQLWLNPQTYDLNVYHNGNFIPTIDVATETKIGGVKLGPGVTLNGQSQLIIDSAGLDFSFGDFYAFTNTGPTDGACLSSVNADQDVNLISNGTGKVNIVGEFHVHKTDSTVEDALASESVFSISPAGFTTINIPVLPIGTSGLLVNGNGTEPFVTTVPGVTLRTVGNDGSPNTVAFDAHGTGSFASLTLRASRGTGTAPTQIKSGDTIGRITGVGFGATTFVTDPLSGRAATDIRFVATEDFTDARSGTKIDFYTSPNGGTVHQLSASIGPTGITANLTGNADTVTNGVYTNGSYANPAWITSLAASKVGLGNVTNESKATMFTSPTFTGTVAGVTKAMVGLGSVENTALSTWAGSTNITTVGTLTSGTIGSGFTAIANSALANSSITVNGTSISLGASGTVTAAAGTLTGTTLNSTVVTSSLTSVGTLTNLAIATGGTITTPRIVINDGGIRTISGGTTCTIDFATDSIILWTAPSGTANITLSNRTAGATVKLIIAMTTARDITYGISSAALSSTGADNWNGTGFGSVDISNTAVHLDYTCITSAVGGCYVAVTAN